MRTPDKPDRGLLCDRREHFHALALAIGDIIPLAGLVPDMFCVYGEMNVAIGRVEDFLPGNEMGRRSLLVEKKVGSHGQHDQVGFLPVGPLVASSGLEEHLPRMF